AVEDELEPSPGDLARVEELDRAGGEVARVGVALLPGVVAGRVYPLKLLQRHEDLAADLDQVRHAGLRRALQVPRERADRERIRGHVVALRPVAPGDRAHEPP